MERSDSTDGRALRGQKTREALIRAAIRLFPVHGFEATSVDALAAEAGVKKALINYHFGGKRELYNTILLSGIREARKELAAVEESTASAPERIEAFIEAMMRALRNQPHFPFMLLREEMSGGRNIAPEVMSEFVGFYNLDREILRQGMDEGAFREVGPHLTHLSLVGALLFYVVTEPLRQEWRMLPEIQEETPELREYLEHVKTLFLRGLESRGRSRVKGRPRPGK